MLNLFKITNLIYKIFIYFIATLLLQPLYLQLNASENFGDAMKWYQSNSAKTARQFYILGLNAENKGDKKNAMTFYRKAAENDSQSSQLRLGFILASSSNLKDQKEAREWFLILSNKKPDATYRLALMYQKGLGGPTDLKKALFYYKKAASLGYKKAFISLANLALQGFDGRPNIIEAMGYIMVAKERYNYDFIDLYNQLSPLIKKDEAEILEIFIASIDSELKRIHLTQ